MSEPVNKFLWNIHTALTTKTLVPKSDEDKRFLVLSMCGEAGEVANLVKKQWRGDEDPQFHAKLREELGDVYAYLLLLAIAYDIDLDQCLHEEIIPKIQARWGHLVT